MGAPNKQDTHGAHGEPLGEEEIKLAKKFYGWPEDAKFLVPDGVYEHFAETHRRRGARRRGEEWLAKFEAYRKEFPAEAKQLDQMQRRELPEGWDKDLPDVPRRRQGHGHPRIVRQGAQRCRQERALAHRRLGRPGPVHQDAAHSSTAPATSRPATTAGATSTSASASTPWARSLNGMSLTRVRPYGAGFLIFSDYARPSLRLSAIMELPAIHVFTHDSIGVGEDGPTHQPIEQLMSLRAVPGMFVIRPADANEVAECWRVAMKLTHNPVAFAMSRQALPTFDRTKYASAAGARQGRVRDGRRRGRQAGRPPVRHRQRGRSAVDAYEKLKAEGVKARVVSMPCWQLFEQQSKEYREGVIPPAVKARVSVEAGTTFGWEKFVGTTGAKIGMSGFGASAPLKDLLKHFGFTADHVAEAAKAQLVGVKKGDN